MNLKKAFQYQKQIARIMVEIIGDEFETAHSPGNYKIAAANPYNFLVMKEVYKRSELNFLFPEEQQNYRDKVRELKSYNTKGYELPKLMAVYAYLADCRRRLAQEFALPEGGFLVNDKIYKDKADAESVGDGKIFSLVN